MIKEITKKFFGIEWDDDKKFSNHCRYCNGLGKIRNNRRCPICNGKGYIIE